MKFRFLFLLIITYTIVMESCVEGSSEHVAGDSLTSDRIEDFGEFPLDNLAWLVGIWQDSANVNQWEEWKLTENGLESRGMFIKGADTTFFERLLIEQRQKGLVMVANVSKNEGPVEFRVTKLQSDMVLFENPEHDFPKSILYRLVNVREDGRFQQKIRGAVRSEERGFTYAMNRR